MWALPLVLLLLCGTGVIGQDYPAVNGYTVRPGDCPGNDIWSIYGEGVTLETCAERCSNHRDCVSFMFYDNTKCYPKTQTCAETDKSNPRNVFYDKSTSILNTADAVGLWPLNSQYGSSDATGNGNDGLARGTQLATGPNGDANGAFLFSGRSSSYIDIPNNGRLDVQSSYTILAHIYPTGEAGPIVNYVGNNNGWAVHLWQTPSRTLFMRTIGRDGHFSSGVGADVLRPSDWNYVGGTYDSNTGMSSIWNDGEMVSQKQIGVSTVATQYPIRVAVREGDSRYFAGRIACIQLYDYAMSQDQINAARDRCVGNANGGPGNTIPPDDTESSGLSGGVIAGIVIGVLVGVGLLVARIHHCSTASSQPTPANRANPTPQAVGMNSTVVHSQTVVSQNPSFNPYPPPPPPQYAPPPAYNIALNMPTQPPPHSSLDSAYAPPHEPSKYGVT